MRKDLVVLAAGMGSRYGGLKQIDPVGPSGELVIDYSVFDAMKAGFDRVIFVIRRDMEEAFRAGIGQALEQRVEVVYAYQALDDLPAPFVPPAGREKPWGTGHAVYAARQQIKHPFAVINADDFYGRQAFALLAEHLDRASLAHEHVMVAYRLDQTVSEHGTVSRGLCRTSPDGYLIDIEEVTAISKSERGLFSGEVKRDDATPTSMNCWGFFPEFLDRLDDHFRAFLHARGGDLKAEFYLPGAVSEMIARGEARARVETTTGRWFGVTYREDKPAVMAGIAALVEAGTYPSPLWSR
ncbi:MAG: nucleotidyltransferase family protein [Kiritimatiellia bacterium]|jgi:hypothetical protein